MVRNSRIERIIQYLQLYPGEWIESGEIGEKLNLVNHEIAILLSKYARGQYERKVENIKTGLYHHVNISYYRWIGESK